MAMDVAATGTVTARDGRVKDMPCPPGAGSIPARRSGTLRAPGLDSPESLGYGPRCGIRQ